VTRPICVGQLAKKADKSLKEHFPLHNSFFAKEIALDFFENGLLLCVN
jgi:hypothetical protein